MARAHQSSASPQMSAAQRAEVGVDISDAAKHLRKMQATELVRSFVAATEKGDAAAATDLCAEDLFFKTHRATTDNLAAAAERFKTRMPAPAKVTKEFHEASPGVIVREIVVKPVPFVTVAVRQEFEVRGIDDGGDIKLCRAEFIKQ